MTKDDPMSQARIRRALGESPDVDPHAVAVQSHDGRIRLSGDVGSYAEKLAALQAVGAEVDVNDIDNRLGVRPYGAHASLPDETIAERVGVALLGLHLPEGTLQFEVDQHVVSLLGTVPTYAMRAAIRHAVEGVDGVNLIESRIVVEPGDDPVRELSDDDSWELLRSAPYGRLAVTTGTDVDIFPINFVVADDRQIFFRTAPGSKLAAIRSNEQVALEVDVFDGMEAWSVVLHGEARLVEEKSEIAAAEDLPLRPLAPTVKDHWVRIAATTISGREFHTAPEPERH